jgi:hypothetical protein
MIKFVSQRPVLGFPPLSYMYVLDMSILPLSVILWLDFGTVPTVWYFLFTSGAGTACLGFCRGSIFSLQCSICISLFAPLSFSSFGHCIVCPSVFWPLYCLSFDLRLLITPLVLSISSYSVNVLIYIRLSLCMREYIVYATLGKS